MSLNSAIGPGSGHDSRRLIGLVGGLEGRPKELYETRHTTPSP